MSCTGACCVAFPVNVTLDTLRAGRPMRPRTLDDADFDLLGFMLRPLTHEEATARRERFGVAKPVGDEQQYRCIYWDEETRLCTIYADRPHVCRDYPHGRGCKHGCDCTDGTPTPARSPRSPEVAPAGRPQGTSANRPG